MISYIRCPNLSAIESWYFGGPELNFKGVVYNNGFSAAFQAFSKTQLPTRTEASSGFTPYQNLFRWYFDDNHGPDYWIQSAEIDDWGGTVEVTAGVTAGIKDVITGSGTCKLTYTAEDLVMLGELIHYATSAPQSFSDSYIIFNIMNVQ